MSLHLSPHGVKSSSKRSIVGNGYVKAISVPLISRLIYGYCLDVALCKRHMGAGVGSAALPNWVNN